MKQLSSNELLNLLGGDSITVEEYCAQLKEIFKDADNQTAGSLEGASYGWLKYCTGRQTNNQKYKSVRQP